MTHPTHRSLLPIWAVLWAVLVAVGLWARPLMPVDETRYLAVAWDMWRDGHFLVPHLNGETYSHKPPLLFWMMHLGWTIFGVSEIWARLVAPLFGLASLALTAALARRLWPDTPGVARTAPMVLIGMIFVGLFTTLTMFDMLVMAFALLGLLGLLMAAQATRLRAFVFGFVLLGVAIGLGVLAKGPAILLHTLPVALLAPWWMARTETRQAPPGGWLAWHGGILGALLMGAAIALSWALPAAEAGGEAYRNAIFWGQSAGRITDSFAHARAWWWYLAMLPALLLPWMIWPKVWRGLAAMGSTFFKDPTLRFLISWTLPAVVVFSVISGKQLHYLLPELAAFALLIARAAKQTEGAGRFDLALPAGLFVVVGVIGLAIPFTPWAARVPTTVMTGWFALPLIAGAVIVVLSLRMPKLCTGMRVGALAVLSMILIVAIHLGARPELARALDMHAPARHFAKLHAEGVNLGHYGKYHGQFHFVGRYPTSFPLAIENHWGAEKWAHENPGGWLIIYRDNPPTDLPADRPYWPFRGQYITLLTAAEIVADRNLALPDPDNPDK